jgi:hypothetical protein
MPVVPTIPPTGVPVMPMVPSVSPIGVPMVPVMPAVTPAAVPVMPTPATVPAPTTEVMRVVVTVAVPRLMPTVAPAVADVSDLLNVRCLRGLTRNGDRHRRRRCARECNGAERGEANKCRNKFHDIHLLTLVGGGQTTKGSAHYAGLMRMNKSTVSFPIFNQPASNVASAWVHQSL